MSFPTTYWPYAKFVYFLIFCMCRLVFMGYHHADCFQKNIDVYFKYSVRAWGNKNEKNGI